MPPPASATRKPLEGFWGKGDERIENACRSDSGTHREDICCKSALNAGVETRFAFRDKPDPRTTLVRVWDQVAVDSRTPHLGLLCPFPTIRVAEDELDRVFYGLPEGFSVCVGIDDETAGASEQVA